MIIGGVVVLVVLILGWWLFTGKKSGTGVEDTSPTTTTEQTTTTSSDTTGSSVSGSVANTPTVSVAAGETVTATDQPAGDSVRIGEARLSRVSWIAVRDDRSILGAARIDPPQGGGTVSDIVVPLLRNTEAGKMYKVVVYADDGDQIFDFKVDAMVDGLGTTFTATNGD